MENNNNRYWTLDEILELPADDQIFEEKGIMDKKEVILEDIQANILKGSKHRYSLYCFITFKTEKKKEMANWLISMPITSALDQQAWKNDKDKNVYNLFLSFEGYKFFFNRNKIKRHIPLEDDHIIAFRKGLSERCPEAFGKQNKKYIEDNYENSSHALIIISSNDETLEKLSKEPDSYTKEESLKQFFNACVADGILDFHKNFKHLFFEIGLRNPEGSNGPPEEWFGFRDGISNPRFFISKDFKANYGFEPDDSAKLKVALRPNYLSPKPFACGSFVVFVKLEQNLEAFHSRVDDLSSELDLEHYKGYSAAYLMGRHKDGTPLHSEFRFPPDGKLNQNDFDYRDDKNGYVCPMHAHIRKANPRDGWDDERIIRRGKVYGHPDSEKKGILFLSFQSSLAQFENIVNIGLYGYNYKNKNTGRDWLFAENAGYPGHQLYRNSKGRLVSPYLGPNKKLIQFRGGHYFFASSISFIRVNLINCM